MRVLVSDIFEDIIFSFSNNEKKIMDLELNAGSIPNIHKISFIIIFFFSVYLNWTLGWV